jgi:hypothetical protein
MNFDNSPTCAASQSSGARWTKSIKYINAIKKINNLRGFAEQQRALHEMVQDVLFGEIFGACIY